MQQLGDFVTSASSHAPPFHWIVRSLGPGLVTVVFILVLLSTEPAVSGDGCSLHGWRVNGWTKLLLPPQHRHSPLPSSRSWQVTRPGSVAELTKGQRYYGSISALTCTIWGEKKDVSQLNPFVKESKKAGSRKVFVPFAPCMFCNFFHSFQGWIRNPLLRRPWFLGETKGSEKSPLASIFSPPDDNSNKES